MSNILTSATASVWTYGNGTTLDHPLTDAIPAAAIKTLRTTLEMNKAVGAITTQVYCQFSVDGETWDTAVLLADPVSTDGTTFGTDFEDVTSYLKPFVRFGVRAVNSSTSSLNFAFVVFRIETR